MEQNNVKIDPESDQPKDWAYQGKRPSQLGCAPTVLMLAVIVYCVEHFCV